MIKRIIVAYDDTDTARRALDRAAEGVRIGGHRDERRPLLVGSPRAAGLIVHPAR